MKTRISAVPIPILLAITALASPATRSWGSGSASYDCNFEDGSYSVAMTADAGFPLDGDVGAPGDVVALGRSTFRIQVTRPWTSGDPVPLMTSESETIIDLPAVPNPPLGVHSNVRIRGGHVILYPDSLPQSSADTIPEPETLPSGAYQTVAETRITGGCSDSTAASDTHTWKLAPAPPLVRGDVDGDGKVTVKDAILALRAVVGLTTLTITQTRAGDLNHDGGVTLADVGLILLAAAIQ